MTFIQESFFEVWMVLLCINCALLVVGHTIPGVPLHTPFDAAASVNPIPLPSSLNYSNTNTTGTIVTGLSTSLKNETNGNPLDPIKDFVFFPLNVIWFFATFVTGGFALSILSIFGFPAIFVTIVQGIMLILMGRGLVYYFSGR
jgi:hypothetical protein